jgi:putative phage-type endonuclease
MSAIIQPHEIQGSASWLAWRKTRGGASEVAALMGCSPWFPQTPHQLWQVKTGRAEVQENDAMRRGSRLEPAARAHAERAAGEVFEPQTVERGRIIASLDGLTFDGSTVLEIKVPAKGDKSDLWSHVMEHDAPPDHYWHQVQQQLYCSGAKRALFFVCVPEQNYSVRCVVTPDLQAHEAIRLAWEQFFGFLDADEPPPLTDRDTRERTDAEWRDAVAAWKEAKAWLDKAKAAEDTARKALLALAEEQTSQGAGVKATRYWVSGGYDYAKAAKAAGVDLSAYEKKGRWQWRLSESDQA